jgi:hypothetical protein
MVRGNVHERDAICRMGVHVCMEAFHTIGSEEQISEFTSEDAGSG